MNEATANLWKIADEAKVAVQYTEATRNKNPDVRASFKAEKDTVGTKAWAICQCMKLACPTTSYTEDEVAQITKALGL